jgi:hypothetical protein
MDLSKKLTSTLIIVGDRAISYLPRSVFSFWPILRLKLKQREEDHLSLPEFIARSKKSSDWNETCISSGSACRILIPQM